MHPPTQSVPHPQAPSRNGSERSREDVVYQIVTLAAILLVLGSLWVF